MDIFDFLWDVRQQRQIRELRDDLDRVRVAHDMAGGDLPRMKGLADENFELKLRLGLLVRLLIVKGVVTAPEYAALIADAHARPTPDGSARPGPG